MIENGIAYLKKWGYKRFIKHLFFWFPQYIKDAFRIIMDNLRLHIDWLDSCILIYEQRRKNSLFLYNKHKNVWDGLQFCEENGLSYKIYNKDELAEVASASYFEGEKRKIVKLACPPIYSCILQDAWIYSASDLIVIGNIALLDMFVKDYEKKRYNVKGGRIIKCKSGKWILTAYEEEPKVIEKGISLLGWASENYYHFTVDILSRLAFVDRDECYSKYPLLVDEGIQKVPQKLRLLQYINRKCHPIIWVGEKFRVKVRELVYISKDTWMPPFFKEKVIPGYGDYIFSKYCVKNIRDIILDQKDWRDESKHKKIYLSRKSSTNPRLINAERIEVLFGGNGYSMMYPENMTLEEQVAAFYNAEVIVGPTGSAFTNIIYCNPRCSVNVITAEENELFFFSNIANMIGVEFTILGAKIVKKGAAISLDTFELDEEKARRFIQSKEVES